MSPERNIHLLGFAGIELLVPEVAQMESTHSSSGLLGVRAKTYSCFCPSVPGILLISDTAI